MTLGPGTVLRGKYRLDEVIGKGGMGEVFAAKQLPQENDVAIKIVNRSMAGEILLQRLHREAIAARRIQSEFVPRLLDVDHTDDGELFLVMDRLYGESLSDRLKRKRALSWQEVNELTLDMLHGMIDAHTAGVVHRDLKPGNVFLERLDPRRSPPRTRERAYILDFGVCKIDTNDVEHLTTTGEALGTIAYMAPEQIRGANKVDERADIYALGMVIFEMLSGRLAYEASGQVALIASKLEHKARSVRDHTLVAIPSGLDNVVSKALGRRPQDRFSSAQEMLKAWRALGPPVVAPRSQSAHSSGQLPSSTDTVMTAGTYQPESRASTLRWAIAISFFASVAVGGIVAASYSRIHKSQAVNSDPSSSADLAATAPSSALSAAPAIPSDPSFVVTTATAPTAATPDPSPQSDDAPGASAPQAQAVRAPSPPPVVKRYPARPAPPPAATVHRTNKPDISTKQGY